MKTNLTSEEFFEKWKKAIEKVDGQLSTVDRDEDYQELEGKIFTIDRDDEDDEACIPLF